VVRFTPGRRTSCTHWIGGWVGPRAGLDAVVKKRNPFWRWLSVWSWNSPSHHPRDLRLAKLLFQIQVTQPISRCFIYNAFSNAGNIQTAMNKRGFYCNAPRCGRMLPEYGSFCKFSGNLSKWIELQILLTQINICTWAHHETKSATNLYSLRYCTKSFEKLKLLLDY
jgi:hypothetical protein